MRRDADAGPRRRAQVRAAVPPRGARRRRSTPTRTTLTRATEGCAGAGLILSVGSGTIVDIGKVVSARLLGVPHVAVQTAASVNGFSDDQSVLLVDGVKRTVSTRWPERLVIDTEVIRRAPAELNRAGLGDLLATYTAPADWRLAQLVGPTTATRRSPSRSPASTSTA